MKTKLYFSFSSDLDEDDCCFKKRERGIYNMKIKKETKTVEYEDLCFGDVFEIDGKFFMKANDCGY